MLTPAQLEVMIRDTGGVDVEFAGVPTWGHLEWEDVPLFDAQGAPVLGTEVSLTVATGILSGLKMGQPITAAARGYTIRDHRRKDDGSLTRIVLMEG